MCESQSYRPSLRYLHVRLAPPSLPTHLSPLISPYLPSSPPISHISTHPSLSQISLISPHLPPSPTSLPTHLSPKSPSSLFQISLIYVPISPRTSPLFLHPHLSSHLAPLPHPHALISPSWKIYPTTRVNRTMASQATVSLSVTPGLRGNRAG